MANERRYRDEEVAAIFEAAATNGGSEPRTAADGEGLTLPELKAIGREVGITAEQIERAAAALDRRGSAARRGTFLGMPLAVGRTAPLTRPLSDREWGILVAEIRETFDAEGTDRSSAGGRHWVNGNLHVFIEEADRGTRIRLGTRKGDATLFNAFGIAAVLIGLGNLTGLLSSTGTGEGLPGASMVAAGAAILLGNALRLWRWAQVRDQQMAHIIERAVDLAHSRSEPAGPAAG